MDVPLDQPHYGIGPAGMVRFLRKYATFRGRASRSEFWWGQLTLFAATMVLLGPGLVVAVVGYVDLMRQAIENPYSTSSTDPALDPLLPGFGLLALGSLLSLAFLVPSIALTWRRLQDAGMHGGLAFAFICGSWAASYVVTFAGLASLVPGFLPSSLRSARYEQSATPVLPPTIDAATWHLTRAWAQAGAAGPAPQQWQAAQQWPGQQWPAQQWPAQAWPQQPQQQWPAQAWPEQSPQQTWPQQPWSQDAWQQTGYQPTHPEAGPYSDPQR
ncbi:DUF805 domain-containing protein [Agrococcus jejuensis]|uniref:DUF805 domain-containing protein n=1 Tax=Agrococcus jejuensis TaxID=399736 RepID=A0A1G8F6C6_9MICO|nr:DUF805 domain-containing protein [Agrococcus jejuensis]SDH77733.1 Protein of unknown function [Agrococcus jejuensis]